MNEYIFEVFMKRKKDREGKLRRCDLMNIMLHSIFRANFLPSMSYNIFVVLVFCSQNASEIF